MQEKRAFVLKAVDYIKPRIGPPPTVGLITGTGLGDSVKTTAAEVSLPCSEIPGFPIPTTASHEGRLSIVVLGTKRVITLHGRAHLYEGYTPLEVTFPVRIMQELGVRHLILCNAAGGISSAFRAGDIMLITDHINLTGHSPLIGPNEEIWGERFPDMTAAYDRDMMKLAQTAAGEVGVTLRQGVYAGLMGPSLETPAEIRFLQTIGAAAVGFSTIQEVIVAVHARMRVLGLSVITNVHDPDRPIPAGVAEIIALARKTAPKLESMIARVVAKL